MYCIKKYGILIDEPNIIFETYTNMIETIFKNNLIPILILQDGLKNNNFLNVHNKIEMLRNKFPELREDNFLILNSEYSYHKNKNLWKVNIKELISKINNYAFGTMDTSINDKCFITNINNYYLVNKGTLYLPSYLNETLQDLLFIADILNLKSEKDKNFDSFFVSLFRDRNDEIKYFDDSLNRTFSSNIKTITGDKSNLVFEDENYINILKKYNLGDLLFNSRKKTINVSNLDLNSVFSFLSSNNVKFKITNQINYKDINGISVIEIN